MIKRDCDLCKALGTSTPATVDTKMKMGPWAYLCDAHNKTHGSNIAGLTNILADIGGDDE